MLASNLRYTFRSFRKHPAFTSIAIASLALGMGANTAIFTLLDRILLRSLPVDHPEQLALLTANGPRRGSVDTAYDDTYTFSYPMYLDFRDRAPDLAGVLCWFPLDASLTMGGATERVAVNVVSGNFFQVLGSGAAIGRPLVPDDTSTVGSGTVAVLSYSLWQQKFGGDPKVLSREVTVNGHSLTVVGVAARGFTGVAVGESPAIFIPVTMKPILVPNRGDMNSRRTMWLNVMGRLKPGVSRTTAEAALNVFWKPILEDELAQMTSGSPQFRRNFLNRHVRLRDASTGISMLRMIFGKPITLLMALVGLVLLIACANVASLLIARAAGRQREIAIRLAVGATRADIASQVFTEAAVLSFAGGALGILFAIWGGRLLLAFLPFGEFTATITANPDWRILAFTAAVSIGCGVVFGLAPALQAGRANLAVTIKEQAASVVSGGLHLMVRRGLVVAQIALSLLLLIGASLFLRSLANLQHLDLGFRPDHLMSFSIQPALNGYSRERAIAFFDALQQRLESLPGVRAVAATQTPVLGNSNWDEGVDVPGYQAKEGDTAPNVDNVNVGYFAALGMPLIAGREFRASDNMASRRVAVVNQTFVKTYFGDANPLGREFYFTADKTASIEIVGVVRDSKYADVREEKQRFVFCPYAQHYVPGMGPLTYYVRTAQEPASLGPVLRQVVREADPSLPIFDLKTMEQQIDDDIFSDRIVSVLSTFFGALATALAGIGLYGLLSYTVTRRTREIGIRMALGAGRGQVLGLVRIGIAIAAPLSYPLSALVKSMLFQTAPGSTWAVIAGATVLSLTALLSAAVPAMRAIGVDPLRALRND